MEFGLNTKTIQGITDVISTNPKVEKVLLYGSRAKGNYKNGSDIDLSLKGSDLNMQDLNQLYVKLDALYLPYSFDILIFEKLNNTELIDHINRVGIVIYERQKN
jgi:predicted nucleotidyltransferase